MCGLASGPCLQVHPRPGRVVCEHYVCHDPIRVDSREVLLVSLLPFLHVASHAACNVAAEIFLTACCPCRYLLFVFLTQMYFTFYGELPFRISQLAVLSCGSALI